MRSKLSKIAALTLCFGLLFGSSPAIPSNAAASGKIENKTMIYGGHTYQLFDTSANWDAAEFFCEHLGGHLVTITTAGEDNAVLRLANKGKRYQYWLGLKADSKGKYSKWVTGESVRYLNWAENEPSGDGTYISICNKSHPWSNKATRWNDLPECGRTDEPWLLSQTGFICEWDSKVYTVQYVLNGGTSPINTQYTYTKKSGMKLKTPKKSGYKFMGWYTDKYFTKKITKIKAGSTTNYILYARWKKL